MAVRRARIGLTLGEESGIGPEVMIRALATVRPEVAVTICVGGGLGSWCDALLAAAGVHADVRQAPDGPDGPVHLAGSSTPDTRTRAFSALSVLADLAVAGEVDAIVTGPVPKAIFAHLDDPPPGQTEYVAARQKTADFAMLLAGPRLRVAPVTTHVPLRDVARLLTSDAIERVGRAVDFELRRSFGVDRPRLAVTGLNPHAGEGGRLGDEEARVIAPAVDRLRDQGVVATGPLSADTVFADALAGRYDAVICMYHDQALGPLKTVHFGEAINFTCGLPVPRMSPDHGTAYDIAGRGLADATSAIAAVRRAAAIATCTTRGQTAATGLRHVRG